MDNRLILVRILAALYLENLFLQGSKPTSFYKEALDRIKPADMGMTNDLGGDATSALKDFIDSLMLNEGLIEMDRETFLQKTRICCTHDNYLYEAVAIVVNREYDEESAVKKIKSLREDVGEFIISENLKEITKFAYKKMHHDKAGSKESYQIVTDIMNRLANVQRDMSFTEKVHPGLVGQVSFSQKGPLAELIRESLVEISPAGTMRFGWQALNDMLGNHQGGRRGETMVVGALPFNFKSGFCLEMFKSVALYNKPWMIDPKKKPLILRISLENSIKQDILYLYKSMMENETGQHVDITTLDPEMAEEYVMRRLGENGYHVELLQYNPSLFSYQDLFDLITKYETDGFEVHFCNIDYLNLMTKKGCEGGGASGQDVRDLFRRVRNFMEQHKIFCLTPHQLAPSARFLLRAGNEDDFVKNIKGKGHWDSCSTIDQEFDIDVSIHVVISNLEKYLTVQRGKHRKFMETDLKDLYWVRKFEKIGGILDDVNGSNLTRYKIGGKTAGGTVEEEWHVGV